MNCENCLHQHVCKYNDRRNQLCNQSKACEHFIQKENLVTLPCKPGDDVFWYDSDENKVKCIEHGVKGVIVLKDGFAVLNTDGCMDPLGTKYSCLTAEECQLKYGLKL